jgi:hypothetical protein
MIAAGVNAKALSTYIGHEDIATTLNKHGHLMPGNEEQAAALLDAYLDAARGRHRDATGTPGPDCAVGCGTAHMYYI